MRISIVFAACLLACASHAQTVLEVEVVLSDLDAGGTLRLALCPSESAFETDKGCTLHTAKAAGSLVRLRIPDLLPGTYAVKIFHDADNDGTLDTNWLGIPSEPYGFSNDAMGSFGPPSFEQARFNVGGEPTTIRIRMKG
jgi:uncharacterized protein (DUF2141 family)